ncbi:hypothetical protein Tco_0635953 [Tanacetum coccineum]
MTPVLALPDGLEAMWCTVYTSGLGLATMIVKFATILSSIKSKILSAQEKASDESAGLQRGLDEMREHRSDGALYYLDQIWVPLKGDVRTLIMDEAHNSKYSVHLGADKMLRLAQAEQQYNLAYFFVKRIESARATPKAHLPYGMFLTRLFRHVMELYPHLDNDIYNVVDHVMRPLALKQTRRPRSNRGKARHFVSSASPHHNLGSSSLQKDDDEDDGVSRASTPSPTTYLNSLEPLNYQQYEIPSPSEQSDDLLFERQTELLNQS